jgi:hypothetical protein
VREQVDQERLEAVQLGLEELGRARRLRVEVAPRLVQHRPREPDRGERRPQLVGHVRDEAALHPAQLLELADLALQGGGHLVERARETGEVVLAGDAQALLQLTRCQTLGHAPREPDGRHDLPGEEPGESRDQGQQQDAGGQQRALDQRQALLHVGEREHVVHRADRLVRGDPDLRPDDDARGLGRRLPLQANRGVGPRRLGRGVEVAHQRLGHAAQVDPEVLRATLLQRSPGLGRPDHHDLETARLPAAADRAVQRLGLLGRVGLGAGGGAESVARLGVLVGDLAQDDVHAVVDQTLLDLAQ